MGSLIGTLLLTVMLVVLAVAAAPSRTLAAEPEPADGVVADEFDFYTQAPGTAQCCRCHQQHCR